MIILEKMTLSIHTLPVELVYHIFDHLNKKSLFLPCGNICSRLNNILDAYQRYQVTESLGGLPRFIFPISNIYLLRIY